MDYKLKVGMAFLCGLASGFLVSRFLLKDKYASWAQEEIDAIKDFYSNKEEQKKSGRYPWKSKETASGQEKPDLSDYVSYVKNSSDYKTESEVKSDKTINILHNARIISPEEFGETGNETVTYTYYADDVVVDDNGSELTEKEMFDRFGCDVKDEFGEYADDCVYFRNDALKLDYEILYDPKKYYEG